jgi:regulator of replication initiation timing
MEKINERLTQTQRNLDSEKNRLNNEIRNSERLRLENEQLRKDNETERNRFTEVRNDLQVAIDSISARGPYINMDMPLDDLESRILRKIRVLNT